MSKVATSKTTTNVVLDPTQSAALAAYMEGTPGLEHRSKAITLLMQRGLDGVQVSSDLRERLERYRTSQEFRLTLDQVIDKLLRQALDVALPQQELKLTAPQPKRARTSAPRKRQ